MLFSVIVLAPVVMFGGYSPNYVCYLILRLITCSALPNIWMASHSISLEIFDQHTRKTMIIVKDFFGPLAAFVLIFIVYNVRHWTDMHLWVGACAALGLPCFFVLPESPRWLANNGRKEEVTKQSLGLKK